ncbi:hypothetical protein [Nitrospirillum amazonense]|uniref:hypothetical protein n=1 Tax=Nitrospirillum amazonense TaxID=28077 RepID=UPI002412595E|nr:hypothetical protein [Nitrospirillum amazonense]MDG3444629.1 hypothetical protein [Nitrospirillum amazonense]
MLFDHSTLAAAAEAIRANPPPPADKTEALWATTHLHHIPEATAVELQAHIRASGTVILRSDEDLPKLMAIVAAWRAHLQLPPVMALSGDTYDAELTVTELNGLITITVGVTTLSSICSEAFNDYLIKDKAEASKSILRALLREKEDGTTLVHEMFDQAINDAIESGDDGFEESDEEDEDD